MEKKVPARSEVPQEMTWRLEDIYPSAEDFEKEYVKIRELTEDFAKLEGTVTKSGAVLLKAYDLLEEIGLLEQRLFGYASMKHDEDTADETGQTLLKRVETLCSGIARDIAFFEPALAAAGEEAVDRMMEEEKGLSKYRVSIKEVFRLKDHMLSPELEKTLAMTREMARVPSSAFSMLADADLVFPAFVDDDGEETPLTNGRFVPVETMASRKVRREVFEKFYGQYAQFKDVWASLYEGQVKQQLFYSRMRGYSSNFEAAADEVNVSVQVCDRLFESVHRHIGKMHDYAALRKELLGVDELHMYDVYAPMIEGGTWEVTYDEAKEMALAALAPLGEDYQALLKEAFAHRWIDVMENKGKKGGAYSTEGVYGLHPYVLLNYTDTLDDVFTLVHELGHAMHTWYSCRNQTLFDSQYKIFVAEVASTTNEILLLEYLLRTTEDKAKQAVLVNHYLESFKSTLFRQTMFEEFERKTNEMGQDGIPLTAQVLSDVYYSLNQEYFGPAMVLDDLIRYEWCRIPHFYYNFYVYQYATSFAASVAIARRILEEGESAAVRFKGFLSSGCTDDPVSLLKRAGVDMSTAEPVDRALEVFGEQIARMKALAAEQGL